MQRCGIDFSIGYRLNYSHQVTTYFLFYLLYSFGNSTKLLQSPCQVYIPNIVNKLTG